MCEGPMLELAQEAASAFSASRRLADKMRFAPFLLKCLAQASPIPDEAPMIQMFLLEKLPNGGLSGFMRLFESKLNHVNAVLSKAGCAVHQIKIP